MNTIYKLITCNLYHVFSKQLVCLLKYHAAVHNREIHAWFLCSSADKNKGHLIPLHKKIFFFPIAWITVLSGIHILFQ